jgi:hypothetical protein
MRDTRNFHQESLWRTLLNTTPRTVIHAMRTGVDQFQEYRKPKYETDTTDPVEKKISKAFKEQTAIGWDGFVRGHISKEWSRIIPHTIDPDEEETLRINEDWTQELITKMWNIFEEQWKQRNGLLYGTTSEAKLEKKKLGLAEQIDKYYADWDAVREDLQEIIFAESADIIKERPIYLQQAWLASAEAATTTPEPEPEPGERKPRGITLLDFWPRARQL